MIIREQEPLAAHTTFRIGGPAAYYLVPESVGEVRDALAFARERKMPFYVLGRGSNMLFDDEGYDGVIIEIGRGLEKMEADSPEKLPDVAVHAEGNAHAGGGAHAGGSVRAGENAHAGGSVRVTAQAGITMAAMAAGLAEKGLTGFEFAGGIPGTLGGGVAMNAGAYGGEIRDCIESATVMTESGEVMVLGREQLGLGYRTSIIQQESYIVLEGTFSFARGERGDILAKMKELNRKRRDKQPLEYPSAGSTFKRPEGYFAGKLIEDAGLRGYRVGDAQVSEKHCGFVVNRGHATAGEVRQLIQDVQDRVRERFQVELQPEVRIMSAH